jgi:hypothetical protein
LLFSYPFPLPGKEAKRQTRLYLFYSSRRDLANEKFGVIFNSKGLSTLIHAVCSPPSRGEWYMRVLGEIGCLLVRVWREFPTFCSSGIRKLRGGRCLFWVLLLPKNLWKVEGGGGRTQPPSHAPSPLWKPLRRLCSSPLCGTALECNTQCIHRSGAIRFRLLSWGGMMALLSSFFF